MSRSNCAFVNCSSHDACEAAMTVFRDLPFRGRRIVCRLRLQPGSSPTLSSSTGSDASTISSSESPTSPSTPSPDNIDHPVIVQSDTPPSASPQSEPKLPGEDSTLDSRPEPVKIPERFFLIKSLTVQDLLASVNNGTWEAQAHNEETLQHAFKNSGNVYLVFSANKSGEYFGLARMKSPMIAKHPNDKPAITPAAVADARSTDPQSIVTPANEVAPSGKIYDDSLSKTIFWEADLPATDGEPKNSCGGPLPKQFDVEWLSTKRVPFFRVRGLRNPWNGLKEVKIARDGTELEPNVGRHLVQMFS